MKCPVRISATLLAFAISSRAPAQRPIIRDESNNAACAREAATAIQQWFISMSTGDTAQLRKLAYPALLVFSFGRNGLPEPFFRADRVDQLIAYAAHRHRAREHLVLLEIRFGPSNHEGAIGFMPIFRRIAADSISTKGLWYGKSEYRCGRGVHVMNLTPWPPGPPYYQPSASRPTG